MKTSFLKKPLFIFLLLVFINPEVKAESFININLSAGIGLRYSGFSFPFPNVNFSKNIGKGIAFVEGSGTMLLIAASAGYEYPLTKRNSVYLAGIKGANLGEKYLGYKIGYVYYSNAVYKRGWMSTLEIYRVNRTLIQSHPPVLFFPLKTIA